MRLWIGQGRPPQGRGAEAAALDGAAAPAGPRIDAWAGTRPAAATPWAAAGWERSGGSGAAAAREAEAAEGEA